MNAIMMTRMYFRVKGRPPDDWAANVSNEFKQHFKQIFLNDSYWREVLGHWMASLPQKSKSLERAEPTNITLNGREMRNKADVDEELERKGHDEICPISKFAVFMPMLSTRGCVKGFHGLENNTAYESIRSADLAHRIHVQKMEKGAFDIEPLAPGIAAAGNGIAAAGKGLHVAGWGFAVASTVAGFGYGAGCIIRAFRSKE